MINRASGCSSILLRKTNSYSLIKFDSGETKYVNSRNSAVLGTCGNASSFLRDYRKAGIIRHLGDVQGIVHVHEIQ